MYLLFKFIINNPGTNADIDNEHLHKLIEGTFLKLKCPIYILVQKYRTVYGYIILFLYLISRYAYFLYDLHSKIKTIRK